MKSIKPGRAPSMMSGVMCIAVAIFGVIWTISAAAMGVGFIALFGIVFIGMAVCMAVYNFKNATGENRYSAFDITEDGEEPDPLNVRYGSTDTFERSDAPKTESRFCPYCGAEAAGDFSFCNKCGKKLP